MVNNDEKTIRFRCPAGLEGTLPPPIPANLGLPGWLKAMPTQAFNVLNMRDEGTIKRCPPFVDAMTCGFLIPLICDLQGRERRDHLGQRYPAGRRARFPALADRFP